MSLMLGNLTIPDIRNPIVKLFTSTFSNNSTLKAPVHILTNLLNFVHRTLTHSISSFSVIITSLQTVTLISNVLTAMQTVGDVAVVAANRILSKFLGKMILLSDPRKINIYLILLISLVVYRCRQSIKHFVITNLPVEPFKQLDSKRTVLREVFRNTPVEKGYTSKNVLHPEQRRCRTDSINFSKLLASSSGYDLYNIQPRLGQTTDNHRMVHHWITDTEIPQKDDQVTNNMIITMFDSDYYEDINHQLKKNYAPHLIYHHSPVDAASPKTLGAPSHTFENDMIIVKDNGSVRYDNYLWDYNTEEISFMRFGKYFIPEHISYQIETKRVSETHALTLIMPRVKFSGIGSFIALARYWIKPIERVKLTEGEFTRMRVITESEDYISIAKQKSYNSARIPVEQLEQLQWLHANAKMPITLPKIRTKTQLNDNQVAIIQEYIIKTTDRNSSKIYTNYKVEYGSNAYQMYPDTAKIDPKPSMISFMFPVSNGAFSPARETSSEVNSIEGRLTKLQQDVRITPKHYKYMEAFVRRLITDDLKHTAHPETVDYVFEAQPRPNQQSILENAVEEGPGMPYVSTFVKKECYGKIADARIISTERPHDKLVWSQFQYVLARLLKKQSWYMFAKTPHKIANKLAKLAKLAREINCTDFSRMDGRKTIVTRTFNLMVMMRYFHPSHHKTIYEQMKRKINSRGSTASFDEDEFKFTTLLAQASGLPDTSNFNSLDNAFINFVGFANMESYNPTEEDFDIAYQKVLNNCAIAGDDTAAADLENDAITKAAAWCGHVITSDIYKRGKSGVNFLARVYGPDLWTGSPNSCTDIMRALNKLHTTTHMDPLITPLDKLGQKLTSLWYTDENTPIIKQLITAFQEVGGKLAERSEQYLLSYWAKYDKTDQYPNFEEEWMWELIPDDSDITGFLTYLGKTRKLDELLVMPLLHDAEVKPHIHQVVLNKDGDQILVGEDSTRVEQPTEQKITIPFIPKLCPIKLTKLLSKKEKPITLKLFNHKKKRSYFKKIKHGMAALDIIFSNQGMGLEVKEGDLRVTAPKPL